MLAIAKDLVDCDPDTSVLVVSGSPMLHAFRIPPRVDYELTTLGCSLLKPVNDIADWARRNRAAMEKAREKFDAGSAASR